MRKASFVLVLLTLTAAALAQATGETRAVVPVVGSTAGAFGSDFKTELQLHNPGSTVMTGRLVFRAQGVPGGPTDPQLEYVLGPSETKYFADVVEEMGATGLGSMDVVPTSGSGIPTVVFRAFDDQEEGTTGVTVPMVLVEKALRVGRKAALLGPMNLEQFRFNIGVRSLGEGAVIRVRLFNADGSLAATVGERTYAPDLFEQRTASDFLGRAIEANQTVEIEVLSGRVIVYGTITDNQTNDGSIQMDPSFNALPVVDDAAGDGELLIVAMTEFEQPVTVSAGVSDPDGDPLSYALGAGPLHGTIGAIMATSSGFSVTYTPAAGFSGNDSFEVVVRDDQGGEITVLVRIVVGDAGNTAPVADAQAVVTSEDTAVAIVLTGSDVDGDALSYNVVTGPSNGALGGTAPNLTYTPNADFNGSDSFTFTVNDGAAESAPATVTITVTPVNDAPAAADHAVTTAEDTPVAIVLSASDVDGDPLSFSVVSGPSNGTLTGTAPNLTYTPNANYNGADSFTFTASDGMATSNVATISITVTSVNDAPVADGQSVTTAEDTPVAILLTGSDVDGDALSFAVGTPSNGTLAGTAPNLTYTPAPNFNGSDSFTFTVSDGTTDSAPATVIITVTPVNDAPLAFDDAVTTPEDTPVAVTLVATDVDGDALTFNVANPANGTLSGTAPNLTYTPNQDFNGADSFTFTASDGMAISNVATVSITVTPVNDAPVIDLDADDSEGTPGSDFAITFTENDPARLLQDGVDATITDVDHATIESLTVTLTNLIDAGQEILDADVTGTPAITKNYDVTTAPGAGVLTLTGPATIGEFETVLRTVTYRNSSENPDTTPRVVTFVASDGIDASAPAISTVTIVAVNDAPVADDATFNVDENSANGTIVGTVSASDVDGDTLSYAITGGTGATAFAIDPVTGEITVADSAQLDFETTPVLTLTVEVTDDGTGNLTDTATITINLNDLNETPVAHDQSMTTDEDVAVVITLTGSDDDGDPLIFAIATGPASGLLSAITPIDATSAQVTYTPNADFNGTDGFSFTVNDGTLSSVAATVSITVDPVNDAPIAAAQAVTTDEDVPVVITLTGSDVDGDSLTFDIGAGPANGSLSAITPIDATSAQVTYTPNTDFNGSDSFTFTANDGAVSSIAATVSITVDSVNDTPTADAQVVTTDEDVPVVITLTGSDVDGDSLTFTIGAGPASGSLSAITPIDATSAQVTYTPAANFNGPDSFTFTVNDGTVSSAAATVSITVDPVNDPPVADAQMVATNEDVAVVITLTGSDIEADPLSFAIVTGPSNGSLSAITPIDATSAQVTYTPNADFFGADSFGFTTNDGAVSSAAAAVSITINPINDPPVVALSQSAFQVEISSPTTTVASFASITSWGPNETDTLLNYVITNSNPSLFATLTLNTAGTLSFRPTTGASGTATITIQARDSGGTNNGGVDTTPLASAPTFTITVAPNAVPTATNKTITAYPNLPISITNAASDNGFRLLDGAVDDGPFPLTVQIMTKAATAEVIIDDPATGAFTYKPATLAFTSGVPNSQSFTYRVCDSAPVPKCSTNATVTVSFVNKLIYFVKAGAPAGGNGSWERPFNVLDGNVFQNRQPFGGPGATVVILSGTYVPTSVLRPKTGEVVVGQGLAGLTLASLGFPDLAVGTIAGIDLASGTVPQINVANGQPGFQNCCTATSFTLRNLKIGGDPASTARALIELEPNLASDNYTFDNLELTGGLAFFLQTSGTLTISNSTIDVRQTFFFLAPMPTVNVVNTDILVQATGGYMFVGTSGRLNIDSDSSITVTRGSITGGTPSSFGPAISGTWACPITITKSVANGSAAEDGSFIAANSTGLTLSGPINVETVSGTGLTLLSVGAGSPLTVTSPITVTTTSGRGLVTLNGTVNLNGAVNVTTDSGAGIEMRPDEFPAGITTIAGQVTVSTQTGLAISVPQNFDPSGTIVMSNAANQVTTTNGSGVNVRNVRIGAAGVNLNVNVTGGNLRFENTGSGSAGPISISSGSINGNGAQNCIDLVAGGNGTANVTAAAGVTTSNCIRTTPPFP